MWSFFQVKLIELIRRMGGSVRRGLERNTTHMVSDTVMARGYLYAYTFQIPVMAPLWIEKSWNHRHLAGFKADCEEMVKSLFLKIHFIPLCSHLYAIIYIPHYDSPGFGSCTHTLQASDALRVCTCTHAHKHTHAHTRMKFKIHNRHIIYSHIQDT